MFDWKLENIRLLDLEKWSLGHVEVKSGKEHVFQNYSGDFLLLCIHETTQ